MKLVSLVVLSLAVVFSSSFTQAMEADETTKQQRIERIGVYSQMPLYALKHNIEKARIDFFQAFNKVNDVKDFNVICKREALTGSNLKHTLCEQYFYKLQRGDIARGFFSGDITRRAGIRSTEAEILKSTEEKRQEALNHFAALINSNAELRDRYFKLKDAKAVYQRRINEQN